MEGRERTRLFAMAQVVFVRGANVGKHRRFQPAALARDLAELGVINVGSVGTFVVLRPIRASALRAEISRRLPFETEIVICSAREILDLEESRPFRDPPPGKDVRELVTVLAKTPKTFPELPLRSPDGDNWQVNLFRIDGRFALTFWRPDPKRLLYPNAVVAENVVGIPGTTRSWSTMSRICGILRR